MINVWSEVFRYHYLPRNDRIVKWNRGMKGDLYKRNWRLLENIATWSMIDVLEYLPGIHLMIYRR